MAKVRLPLNAFCVDCGGMFRRSTGTNLIRCKNCRKNKQGIHSGMKKGQSKICPICKRRKHKLSKVCKKCFKVINLQISSNAFKNIYDEVDEATQDNTPIRESIRFDKFEDDDNPHYYKKNGMEHKKVNLKIPSDLARKKKISRERKKLQKCNNNKDVVIEDDRNYSWVYGKYSREYEALREDADVGKVLPVMPAVNEFNNIITDDVMSGQFELRGKKQEKIVDPRYLGLLNKFLKQGLSGNIASKKALKEYNKTNG